MTQPLLVEQRGSVAWVTLNRPDRLNALDRPLIDDCLRISLGLLVIARPASSS